MSSELRDRAGRFRTPVAALVALIVFVLLGAGLIAFFLEGERDRELLQWESRLGLVADTKAEAIARLLAGDRRDLEDLANNGSLQLYAWQILQARDAGAREVEPAQQVYLRNLLVAAAERGGYLADPALDVPANLPRSQSGGMALLDPELRAIVTTPGLAVPAGDAARIARRALNRGTTVIDLTLDPAARPTVIIATPVRAVSGVLRGGAEGSSPTAPTAVLLAQRSAGKDLYPVLGRGPGFAEDSETLLVARRDQTLIYLSPLRDGTEPLGRSIALDRAQVAEVAASAQPAGMHQLDNYRGLPVFAAARRVRGTDWMLIQEVDAREAMSVAKERRTYLLATLSLLLFSIATLAVAAWRHGSSVRARVHAAELEAKAAKLQRQTELLHTVTDNIDVLTLLINREQTVLFINQAAARAARSSISRLVNGHLAAVFGAEVADRLAAIGEDVRRERATAYRLLPLRLGDIDRSYQASFIPVERIGDRRQLVLMVFNDVTELQMAEARHAALLRTLVGTLSHAVDLHDPWSVNHADRMAEVAQAVAAELDVPAVERETLGLAATLANIGKIMIPGDLLTKTEPLTAADRELLQKHVEYSLELLKGLDFEGPVLDVIAQKQERLDGSGYPLGLTGDQLTLPGRILSVANAFVALVSARAYRQGISIHDALDALMQGAGTQYDRRVIAALFHVVENRKDWARWV